VEFALPESWQSPEDERLAAEAQAKKEAADAARRKRLAAEQKKKDAELNARIAKARAEEEARNANRTPEGSSGLYHHLPEHCR
jgi:hypothetical protein